MDNLKGHVFSGFAVMTASEMPEAAWAWLALIRRPQGRRGEVFADLLTDFPEKFSERRKLWLVAGAAANSAPKVQTALRPALPAPVRLLAHWQHKGGIVLHFAGVDSISAAEALSGLAVAIPQTERVPLAGDETYISDLIGCTLVDTTPAEPSAVGLIEDVDLGSGPVAMLIVCGPRGEVLVPFAKSYLRRIDLEAKRIEMALPEGLADLNASE
ncbi:MAG TPA: ribosome maturation factor RimM [Terracidiphilus sp.]|nr:ribosome maturation factor RimM [Terracidiphilus sp.]